MKIWPLKGISKNIVPLTQIVFKTLEKIQILLKLGAKQIENGALYSRTSTPFSGIPCTMPGGDVTLATSCRCVHASLDHGRPLHRHLLGRPERLGLGEAEVGFRHPPGACPRSGAQGCASSSSQMSHCPQDEIRTLFCSATVAVVPRLQQQPGLLGCLQTVVCLCPCTVG